MKEHLKVKKYKFFLNQGLYWAAVGAFSGYIVAFALSKGYSEVTVSRLMSVNAVIGILSTAMGSALSDVLKTRKKLFIIEMLLIPLCNIGLFRAQNITEFSAFFLLLTLVGSPVYAIYDSWSLDLMEHDPALYGPSRSGGSFGYAVMMLVMGRLIELRGYGIAVITAGILYLAAAAAVFTLPDIQPAGNRMKKQKNAAASLVECFRHPDYLLLLIFMFTLGLSSMPFNNLKVLILSGAGGSVSTVGIDAFTGCCVQMVVFLISGKCLMRFRPQMILVCCASMMVVGYFLALTAANVWQVIAGSAIVQAVYGLLIPAARLMTQELVTNDNQTFANSLTDVCYASLSTMIAMSYSGNLASLYGIRSVLRISCITGLTAASMMTWFLLRGIKTEREYRRKTNDLRDFSGFPCNKGNL